METQTSLTFNINNKVRLRLTQHGVAVLKAHHDELMKRLPKQLRREFELKLDDAGIWEEQLWVVMNKLGPSIYNGGKLLIESNNIVIPFAKI